MKNCFYCLKELPAFADLEMIEFSVICQSTLRKKLSKGETLFHQGEKISSIYLIKKGSIKLNQVTEEGRELVIDVLGSGEVLGEMALFQNKEMSCSAVAREDTMICCFSREKLEKVIKDNPALAIKIISNLGMKLNHAHEKIGDNALPLVKQRIVKTFNRFAKEYGSKTLEGIKIDITITQEELASMVGASRVMVGHVIKELRESNLLDNQGKHYILKTDPCIIKNFERSAI